MCMQTVKFGKLISFHLMLKSETCQSSCGLELKSCFCLRPWMDADIKHTLTFSFLGHSLQGEEGSVGWPWIRAFWRCGRVTSQLLGHACKLADMSDSVSFPVKGEQCWCSDSCGSVPPVSGCESCGMCPCRRGSWHHW